MTATPPDRQTSTVIPRMAHNIALWNKFASENKILPSYPAVKDQLESVVVDNRKLFPFGYNPSIVRHNGGICMSYRSHPHKSWQTLLGIANLDNNFSVSLNSDMKLAGTSNEDGRLFEHNGDLYISYVHAHGGGNGAMPICEMRYGRWGYLGVDGQHLVKYRNNGISGMEKNWVPFEFGGKVHFIYQCGPNGHIVIQVDGSEVKGEHITACPRWKYGPIRGGTTPVEYEGKWLRFFHSRLDNEPLPYRFRYYVGALLMNPKPPFEVLKVSSKPILRGSEVDHLSETEKSGCHHHKPNCVLPYGCVVDGDKFFVSVGCNDSSSIIVTVREKDLNL